MRPAFLACSSLFFLAICFQPVCAQSAPSPTMPDAASIKELRYDVGTITSGMYSNQCFGLSIVIPTDWRVSDFPGNAEGKALQLPGGALRLFELQKDAFGFKGMRVSLTASPVRDFTVPAEAVANNSARAQVAFDPQKRSVMRIAYPVSYGGMQFYRADYKEVMPTGDTLYLSHVLMTFRRYYIGAFLVADSPERLDAAADLLKTITFQEDVVNPNCFVGRDEYDGRSGVVGPIAGEIGPKARVAPAQRIRVSMGVAQGLLISKVEPEYPEAARQAGVHGHVVLNTIIGIDGSVQEARAIAGDPLLLPAAIAAVKQWKYKPYLLDGQAISLDTTVNVDFTEQK